MLDCADPGTQVRWWHGVVGGELGHDEQQGWWWVDPGGAWPWESIVFTAVPEPKRGRNRVHWDLWADAGQVHAAGATVLERQPDRTVMADPEGNEFCVFAPPQCALD